MESGQVDGGGLVANLSAVSGLWMRWPLSRMVKMRERSMIVFLSVMLK